MTPTSQLPGPNGAEPGQDTVESNALSTDRPLALRFVSPAQIERDPKQPRRSVGNLEGLMESIRAEGILQPLLVCPVEGDETRYRLIAGERRLTAAQQLGLAEVSIIVRAMEEHSWLAAQLIENIQREDLHPVDEAIGIARLITECQISQRDAAGRLGKSPASINEMLRLLDLSEPMLLDVRTSDHPAARNKSLLLEIAKERNSQRQEVLWSLALSGDLTVQRARDERGMSVALKAKEGGGRKKASNSNTRTWSLDVTDAKVSVRLQGGAATTVRSALEEALKSLEAAVSGLR